MTAKLIVAVVFVWAVCQVTDATAINSTILTSDITSDGCNTTKQCWSNVVGCNPSVNSSCFFTSINVTSQGVVIELSGPNNGFVALGLNKNQSEISDVVFVCSKNNNSFVFETATRNNTALTPVNVTTVNTVQYLLNKTQTQCTFSISTNLTINLTINSTMNFSLIDTTTHFTIINGTTNETKLENANTVHQFNTTLNLPNSTTDNNNTTATDNTTLISPANTTVKSLNITHEGCNSTKLCFPNTSCKPQDNSTCFFASSKRNSDQTYSFELSGPSSGYIGLALTRANQTYVFVCGKNSITGKCFLQVTAENNKTLVPFNMPVNNFQGVVYKNNMNENLIQCVFNAKTNFNPSFNVSDGNFIVAFYNGSTNGAQLDSPKTLVNGISVDLANPSSLTANSASLASHWTHVLAVLFGTMILHFITSHSP